MALSLPVPTFGFYQRLSARERMLTLLVGATVFVVINLILLSMLIGSFGENRRLYAQQSQELKIQSLFAGELPMWKQRMDWLKARQPALTNRSRAGTELLEQVQGAARVSKVIITNPQIKPPPVTPGGGKDLTGRDYQAVSVEFDTESDWGALIGFAQTLQKPEAFLVFDLATLRSDPGNAEQIKGQFRVSKWYAPASK